MTNREEAIKRVADGIDETPDDIIFYMRPHRSSSKLATYAVDTTEKLLTAEARVLELEAALREILGDGEIDAALQRCDEYPQSMKQAHAALQPKGE